MNSGPIGQLKRIEEIFKEIRLSPLEKRRAARNLEAVAERLRNRDYSRASYAENKFNIPERIRDFFVELEFYSGLGRSWQAVFQALNLKGVRSILDLCPGSFPKVELGLLYSDFTGRVTILDSDSGALKSAIKFLRLFEPPFETEAAVMDLGCYKGRRFDLITANHVLDDLAMHHGCKRAGLRLSEVYEKEGNLLSLWRCILSNQETIRGQVIGTLTGAVDRLAGRNAAVIITQYPSYVERSLGLEDVSAFNRSLLEESAEVLQEKGFSLDRKFRFRSPRGVLKIFGPNDCRVLRR